MRRFFKFSAVFFTSVLDFDSFGKHTQSKYITKKEEEEKVHRTTKRKRKKKEASRNIRRAQKEKKKKEHIRESILDGGFLKV